MDRALKNLEINQPESLSKMAYHALRNVILEGHLKRGEIYSEMALAKELGISRTPVREALLELSSKDLVTFLPRRGVIVNSFTDQDIEEVFELRKAIELAAVEKVCGLSSACDFSKMQETIDKQRDAAKVLDYKAFIQWDRKFHTLFCELMGNRRILAILENIRDIVHLMGWQAMIVDGRLKTVIEEHKNVLDEVSDGKTESARHAMVNHLEMSKNAVFLQRNAECREL